MKDTYYARTRADFLNQAFHTHFEQHRQAVWANPNGVDVWMVRMDGQVRDGWKNNLYENKIIEQFVGVNPPSIDSGISITRIPVNIIDSQADATISIYKILGTYELSIKESKLATYRVWRKISDKF